MLFLLAYSVPILSYWPVSWAASLISQISSMLASPPPRELANCLLAPVHKSPSHHPTSLLLIRSPSKDTFQEVFSKCRRHSSPTPNTTETLLFSRAVNGPFFSPLSSLRAPCPLSADQLMSALLLKLEGHSNSAPDSLSVAWLTPAPTSLLVASCLPHELHQTLDSAW